VFGGNLTRSGATVHVTPLDSFRMRVYLAPYGLWLTLDAGKFREVSFDPRSQSVRLVLDPASEFTKDALLRVEQPATIAGVGHFRTEKPFAVVRGAYDIPLGSGENEVVLNAEGKAAQ
jgi:hypothetical protein